jgi:hypothetical protein
LSPGASKPEDGAQFPIGTAEMAEDSFRLSQALRRFLNASAALRADSKLARSLVADLDSWSERFERNAGSEEISLWRKARRDQPPALLPALSFSKNGDELSGCVNFGRFHVGRGAAHGGAIALVFDEVMGALAGSLQGNRTRTAYLHIDYRAVTPIDKALNIRAWFDAVEGRKRLLRASIGDGDVTCAEARGLWLELRPGQP